jgi:murein DD-endopeptidase MepM/ murein hydrolase activator NlpD
VKPRLLLLLAALAATGGCGIPRWPVDAPLTSDFGLRFRGLSPDIHRGVDLRAPMGTEVRSMAAGTVRFAGTMSGFGNVVWLDHGARILTVYAHLSQIHVRQGQRLGAGQPLGLSGQSGDATAPHLHFEVWQGGHEVDPVPLLGGRPGR